MRIQEQSSNSISPQGEVVGFNVSSRSWVTAGALDSDCVKLPQLKGRLLLDEQSLSECTGDFGGLVRRRPLARLAAGSVDDIQKMIGFARQAHLKIGPRGMGHTLYGQSQVEGGIVIDMRGLSTLHVLEYDRVKVDAGILWRDLVKSTLARGLVPPVLTDLLELTVGGTLSVGGLTGNTYRSGLQADHVLELEVVTGTGELKTCSRSQERPLFDAVLAGYGQCGIIVRATLRLETAPAQVRLFDLDYADVETQLRDQRRACDDHRFHYVLGFALPDGDAWKHRMQLLVYCNEPALLDNAKLLEGLSHVRGSERIVDMSYSQWVNRLQPQLEELRSLGLDTRPHPWSDLFVPDSRIDAFAREVLAEVPPREVDNYFPVLFYLLKRDRLNCPLFSLPDEAVCFLFGVLKTATPETLSATEMVADNRKLYDRNRQWGGTHYAHAALELSAEDWQARFGRAWDGFVAAKRRYDPDHVLTPGPRIFP